MKSIYNPFYNKPFLSKHDIPVSGLASLAFCLSFVFAVASAVFLLLSLLTIKNVDFSENAPVFFMLIILAYSLNIFAKKETLKTISDEQLEFLIKNKERLCIEEINKMMSKKEFIKFVDLAYKIDKKAYENGETNKENFILTHYSAPT